MSVVTAQRVQSQKPQPLMLAGYDRSDSIEQMPPRLKLLEYGRAELVKLMLEGRQHHLVMAAAKDSRFKPQELLAMVRKYPRKADWADGDLWQMLQLAMRSVRDNAEAMEEHNVAIAVAGEHYQTLAEVRRMLEESWKPLRQIARESGVSRGTVCAIASGSVVKLSTAQRLAEHLGRCAIRRPAAAQFSGFARRPRHAELVVPRLRVLFS